MERVQQPTNKNSSDFIQSVRKGWFVVKSGKIMGIRGLDVKTVKVTQTFEEDVLFLENITVFSRRFCHRWSAIYPGIP